MKNKGYTNLLHFENLLSTDSLFHFSTNILDGKSRNSYSSFNLSPFSGDNPDSVKTNRKLLTDAMKISENDLYTPYQIHENKICIIDNDFLTKTFNEKQALLNGIDAVITNQKNIGIGITTADCVPILIYDPEQQALGVIHAGWRGTVATIASKTVETMAEKYGSSPTSLLAGIGPSISQANFEVGEEVAQAFIDAGFNLETIGYRNPKSGKMHINLQKANTELLIQVGLKVENIEIADLCTFNNKDLFFSARRQGIKSGRMITGGVLR